MIELGQHPADEVTLFGHTIHGLLRISGSLRWVEVDGELFPLPDAYNQGLETRRVAQVVKKPGVGAVALTAEQLASERAMGRVWQNYAMLRGNLSMFGMPLGGWIYFDSLGDRWLIRPESMPSLTAGASYSITFSIRPFGYLDEEPATPRTVTVTLANTQQSTSPGLVRFVEVDTVRGDGAQALLRVALNGYTAGYLAVDVSGDGDAIALTLSVLRSEAAVLGTWTNNTANLNLAPSGVYRLVATPTPPGLLPSYTFPPGGATVTWTADHLVRIENTNLAGAFATVLQASYTAGRTGRLLALVYDETDQLVEFTYDTTYALNLDYPHFDVEVSGSASITANSGGLANKATVGTINISMARSVTNRVAVVVSLRRDGVLLASDEGEVLYTGTQTYSGSFVNPNFGYDASAAEWRMVEYPTNWSSQSGSEALTVPEPFAASAVSAPFSLLAPVTRFWGVNAMYPSTGERDAYGIGAFLQISDSINQQMREEWRDGLPNGGVTLSRRHRVASTSTEYELVMAYPHAELVARGAGPAGTAYHPVTHVIATDNENGPASGFV